MIYLSLAFLLASVLPAMAHVQWADGTPVPNWVKSQCCGVADAHHLRPDQVHVVPGGYRVDGYAKDLTEAQKQPSPDGSWWVFYRDYPDGTQSGVFCFFGPVAGV